MVRLFNKHLYTFFGRFQGFFCFFLKSYLHFVLTLND